MMDLMALDLKVRKGVDITTITNVRFQKILPNELYILKLHSGLRESFRAVKFIGFGKSLDELVDERPLGRDTGDGFYFFKALTEDGFEDMIHAFGYCDSYNISDHEIYPNMNIRKLTKVTVQKFKD